MHIHSAMLHNIPNNLTVSGFRRAKLPCINRPSWILAQNLDRKAETINTLL